MQYKTLSPLFLVIHFLAFANNPAHCQQKNDTLSRLLDYSRPGVEHKRLSAIAGSWDFQDLKRGYVKGILVRREIFDGRFYSVEITGGKLSVPVANGLMKEDNYQSLQWEGFDNPRQTYFVTSINNHIGSDQQGQKGYYDSTTNTFTYEWETELLPDYRVQNKRMLKIIDSNTYTEEYFEKQNGQWKKVRELKYSRRIADQTN
jgi:hypothetical protein